MPVFNIPGCEDVQFSPYQARVFDFILNGSGDLVVEAVAGSGKTFTIKCAAHLISVPGVYIVFNKKNAREAQEKLAGSMVDPTTCNSLGSRALRRQFPKSALHGGQRGAPQKGAELLKRITRAIEAGKDLTRVGVDPTPEQESDIRAAGLSFTYLRLYDLARAALVDPRNGREVCVEQMSDIIAHHGLELPMEDLAVNVVYAMLLAGLKELPVCHDFGDQIWATVLLGLPVSQSMWVFVDEAQDLTPAQLALVQMARKPGGRIVAVGDRRQAIYGFAGADCASFQNIIDTLKAQVLPLSVCYRCPTTHLDIAREIVPSIEAREGAPAGVVQTVKLDDVCDKVTPESLVICRSNAPLLTLAYKYIARGVSVKVMGRDIGKGLARAVKEILGRGRNALGMDLAEVWGERSEKYQNRETDRLKKACGNNKNRLAQRMEQLEDKMLCLSAILEGADCATGQDLLDAIDRIFSDETVKNGVTMSSVHRAKGLEANHVAILEPSKLGVHRENNQDWQNEQETNLRYIALTRSMDTLTYIESK